MTEPVYALHAYGEMELQKASDSVAADQCHTEKVDNSQEEK